MKGYHSVRPNTLERRTPIYCNRDIKCFDCLGFGHVASQCPNKRVIVMKVNNGVKTDGEDEDEKMPPLEVADDVCVEYPVEGEALMVRRVMNMHVKVDDSGGQRDNIFHMRCHVHNKICSLIIDGASCTK